MVKPGDAVELPTRKIGQAPRRGTVTGVVGSMVRVRWETGEETNFIPSAGSLTVLAPTAGAERGDRA